MSDNNVIPIDRFREIRREAQGTPDSSDTKLAELLKDLRVRSDALTRQFREEWGTFGAGIDDAVDKPHNRDMPDITREELDAKLGRVEDAAKAMVRELAIEMRAADQARQAVWDKNFGAYTGKIDGQIEALKTLTATWQAESRLEVQDMKAAVRADGRATRWTNIALIIAVLAAGVGVWQANLAATANMLSAFQTALGIRSLPDTPQKPPTK